MLTKGRGWQHHQPALETIASTLNSNKTSARGCTSQTCTLVPVTFAKTCTNTRLVATLCGRRAQLGETKAAMEGKLDKMRAQQEAAAAKEAAAHSKQLKAREIEVSQLENVHASVKAQLEQRVAELEGKLSKARDATRRADLRRAREAEGFASDITLLRQQLMAVDRTLHQMRLQSRLQDDERLDGLLKKVQAKGGASQVRFEPSSMQSSPGV